MEIQCLSWPSIQSVLSFFDCRKRNFFEVGAFGKILSDKYVELRNVEVSDQDKDRLAEYIISELPTLLGGIYWNDKLYNLILYPTYIRPFAK